MGDVIQSNLKKYRILIILAATVLLAITIKSSWDEKENSFDERAARVKINKLIYDLEADDCEVEFELPYCVFDSEGKVLMTTDIEFNSGEQVDLHTIGGSRQYIVPIKISDESLILFVDCGSLYSSSETNRFILTSVIAIGLWVVLIIILILQRKLIKNDVLRPVKELHNSTKAILAGDLKTEVKYDYDGAIGSLCHDFEQMRDELADSKERELQLKEKVHVMYASISHDLKTPLATITGYLEGIIYDVVKSPEDIKLYAERMLNKSQVLNQLIDDILEHSRAELNELSIRKQEVYAREYFGELLGSYDKDIKNFSYDLPDNIIIQIDPARIAEVFQNIIGNALKYGHESVKLNVSFEVIKENESLLLVNITDNGPGIDAADLPFIFDMFYRGNKARTQDVPGAGLGLNIAKYIIEKHGGRIECDSIVGTGTKMTFSLPID